MNPAEWNEYKLRQLSDSIEEQRNSIKPYLRKVFDGAVLDYLRYMHNPKNRIYRIHSFRKSKEYNHFSKISTINRRRAKRKLKLKNRH
jgi:hypothetical protein